MKFRTPLIFVLGSLLLAAGRLASGAYSSADRLALVKIDLVHSSDLDLVESAGLPVYARLTGGDASPYLLAGLAIDQVWPSGIQFTILDSDMEGATYILAYAMPNHPLPNWETYGIPLLNDGLQVLLRIQPGELTRLVAEGVQVQSLTMDPKPLRRDILPLHRFAVTAPNSLVEEVLTQIDSSTLISYTADLSGENSVLIGSEAYTITTRYTYSGEPIRKATEYVGEHLEVLGLQVEYHQWESANYPNVIGELTGVAESEQVYIIGAHLDDMPSGPLAPGADDNASGVVATLIAADILTQYPWNCTLRFAFWTGEEQGLKGSAAYARRAYEQGEQILGYLNLDMIGYNTPFSSPDIDLHATENITETLELAHLFADTVEIYTLELVPEIVPNGTRYSDHASFWQYGYPAILGIEDFGDFNPNYHQADDLLEYLDIGYMTEFVKASVAAFVHMADCTCLSASEPQIAWQPDEPVTERDAVAYTATVAGTEPFTYTWDFGGPGYGIDIETAEPVYTYTKPGSYTVTLTVENGCGSGQASAQVDVLCLAPDAELIANDPVPLREPVFLTATLYGTAPISYTWDFGGKGMVVGGETLTPVVTYADAGFYTVTLDLESGCGSAQLARKVKVMERWFAYLPLVWADR